MNGADQDENMERIRPETCPILQGGNIPDNFEKIVVSWELI